ncbi:MAG: hypothetical protein JF591_21245 [Lysobacter sp.]|nr:hypothetical protein [Lysobacter sp.]
MSIACAHATELGESPFSLRSAEPGTVRALAVARAEFVKRLALEAGPDSADDAAMRQADDFDIAITQDADHYRVDFAPSQRGYRGGGYGYLIAKDSFRVVERRMYP